MVVGDFRTEVDVLVVGAGPGGYVAAIRAAQLGKQVVLADRREIGGVCLNRGCIPSKALISAARRYEQTLLGERIGISAGDVRVDFGKVQAWKQSVVDKLTGGIGALLASYGVHVVSGEVFFNEPNVATVGTDEGASRYVFRHGIIATGSRPIELRGFPFGGRILSSDEALVLPDIPKRLVVIGGGYIGIELGQTFAKFGTQVTILEASGAILPGFAAELSRPVLTSLKKSGVTVHTGATAKRAEATGRDVTVTFAVGGNEQAVSADYALVTVGRRPNTDEIGLETIGVAMSDRGLIDVDAQCCTSIPHLYAIGDVVAGPALAHKASYEGKVAAEAIAGMRSAVDYKAIPAVVFSDPEIASVGWTEAQARENNYNAVTGRFSFGANGRALALGDSDGFVSLVADKETGLVLGAHIVGPEASDLIAELGLAIEMGATLEDIALTIHAHPTLGEAVMEAAEGALGHSVHQLRQK